MMRQRLFLPIFKVKRTDYIIDVSHLRVFPFLLFYKEHAVFFQR
jgi:hypothetical protein